MDIDPTSTTQKQLRFVVAPGPTIASNAYASLLPPPHECEDGEWCEVCPEGLVMVKEMARRIRESGGGAALIADYGQDGVRKNTLRVSYHRADNCWGQHSHTSQQIYCIVWVL